MREMMSGMNTTIAFLIGYLACAVTVWWFRQCLFASRNLVCYKKPRCGRAWPEWIRKK